MENNYYIILHKWLIFNPEFNEKLDEYYDIINKYEKIIFSNNYKPLIKIKSNIIEIEPNIIDINKSYLFYGIFNQEINL